jgi:hypothetical protein
MTITINGSNVPVDTIVFNRIPGVKLTQQILMFLISIVFVS